MKNQSNCELVILKINHRTIRLYYILNNISIVFKNIRALNLINQIKKLIECRTLVFRYSHLLICLSCLSADPTNDLSVKSK